MIDTLSGIKILKTHLVLVSTKVLYRKIL